MYVVRIIDNNGKVDFKVYFKRDDAMQRYNQAWRQTDDGNFLSTAVFEVHQTDDVRTAIELVKSGEKSQVELLEIKLPVDIEIMKLDLDIS